jgi:hypothetical protein
MKTKQEILDQTYLSAKDLKVIMPHIGLNKCRKYIEETIEEMKEKKLYVPEGKTKIALTKMLRKKFGF